MGTIGLGNIGSEMVRIMRPLGLTFIAYDPNVEEARARDLGVNLVDLETVFCASDILTINCPLTNSTRGLVNAEGLAMMKPTAFLINTARGAIVDQGALTEALVARRIAGAGLDVFDPEPPRSDDPLFGLDTVVLAPHSVAMTDELISQCGALAIEAVLDVMHGREPQGIVSRRAVSILNGGSVLTPTVRSSAAVFKKGRCRRKQPPGNSSPVERDQDGGVRKECRWMHNRELQAV